MDGNREDIICTASIEGAGNAEDIKSKEVIVLVASRTAKQAINVHSVHQSKKSFLLTHIVPRLQLTLSWLEGVREQLKHDVV